MNSDLDRDKYFRVALLTATPKPQTACWYAMHQDYSEDFVFNEVPPSEAKAGEIIVKRLLAGERGHYGCLEHPAITLNIGWFPHTVMQQLRTHRVGVSFDVQSGRYTSTRILEAASGHRALEEVFYLRPVGRYSDRSGKHYDYPESARAFDLERLKDVANHYANQIRGGLSEEHARELIPYAIRQHFVLTCNMRSLMHILDLRYKADAQLEIRQLCHLMLPHFRNWAPAVADWYDTHRLGRARLAP